MRILTGILASMLALSTANAQVYFYVDEQGNKVFTDKPPVNRSATEVNLRPLNTTPMETPEASQPPRQSHLRDEDEATTHYQTLEITGLPDEGAIRANDGTLTISVRIEPPLAPLHRLQLIVDGQPHGTPVRSSQLSASDIERGQHSVAVRVLQDGKAVQQSTPREVIVLRSHVNQPGRRR